jgi:hypothetical protein
MKTFAWPIAKIVCAAGIVALLLWLGYEQRIQAQRTDTLLKEQADNLIGKLSSEQEQVSFTRLAMEHQAADLIKKLSEQEQARAAAAQQTADSTIKKLSEQEQARAAAAQQTADSTIKKLSEQEQARAAAAQQTADLIKKLSDEQEKARVETAQQAADLSKRIDDLLESGALFPNKSKPAAEAEALAKDALAKNDRQLAKIYYLSAVNHAPSEERFLAAYADLIFATEGSSMEDLSRLKSVLQISLYQVPPQRIQSILGLLTKLSEKENVLVQAQRAKVLNTDWKAEFAKLTAQALDQICMDENALARRLDALTEVLEGIDNQEEPDKAFRGAVEEEAARTRQVLTAIRTANVLDRLLKELNSDVERLPNKALSILQTAEAMLGNLWGINSSNLPVPLRSKIDGYADTLRQSAEKVAEVKSRPLLNDVNAQLVAARTYKSVGVGQPLQYSIVYYEACFIKASNARREILSATSGNQAEAQLTEIRKLDEDARRQQKSKYQEWVVSRCDPTFEAYKTTFTAGGYLKNKGYTSPRARTIFSESEFEKVDQSSLTPETARLFNDVLQKLLAEMNGEDAFATWKEMAEASKKKLEDY